MNSLQFKNDPYEMNWLREDCEYAKVVCPEELSYKVENKWEGSKLRTAVTFTNHTEKPVFTAVDTIGIYFPLNDRYEDSETCRTSRCHTHLFCGGDSSYVMALRMGGEAPHFGMVVTRGGLDSYSIERDFSKMSNDRGIFILHPSPFELDAKESFVLEWEIFSHAGKEDFYQKLQGYDRFIDVRAQRYVMYEKEQNEILVKPSYKADMVTVNGERVLLENGRYQFKYEPGSSGEKLFHIEVDGIQTSLRILVLPEFLQLAGTRCHFIAENQQYSGRCGHLNGAYLSYDNEEHHIFYNKENDYNGGRERAGMGLLMAKYLQHQKDPVLEESLEKYIGYVTRELVDVHTGEVFNDMGYDNSYERLYNCPWYATLFVELYFLYGRKEYLDYSVRILKMFYHKGGTKHYSIELPVLSLCKALTYENMEEEKRELSGLFMAHADYIMETGTAYPAHEVNYEQSIVAPAANILLQVYLLTKQEKYLTAGKKQLEVLELFNGCQPDYHLYETAVRHWDGYWFGKRKLYGDTYPHYWSGLTGNTFLLYAMITGKQEYIQKAEHSLRGVLSMIHEDGTATCAYVYPHKVNGIRADFADPMANDQDWGVYFMLRRIYDLPKGMEDTPPFIV